MTTLVCESPAVRANLERMQSLLEGAGAVLDKDLIIEQRGNSLAVRSATPGGGEQLLISLPESCLIPFDGLALAVQADSLVLESVDPSLTELQAELAGVLVDIDNQTHKLAEHRAQQPLFTLRREPELTARLGRLNPRMASLWEQLAQGDSEEEVLLASFFKTRTLKFKGGEQAQGQRILMPFIDFANHHAQGAGFRNHRNARGETCVGLANSTPVEGSDECFARYGASYGPVDTFLGYGFWDRRADTPYLNSIPTELSLADSGTLLISSSKSSPYRGKLAPRLESLRPWLPRVDLRRDEKVAGLSHLRIPLDHSLRALRRALALVIGRLSPGLTGNALEAAVLSDEQQLLRDHLGFYRDLRDAALAPRCPDTPAAALDELVALCDFLLAALQRYCDHHKIDTAA